MLKKIRDRFVSPLKSDLEKLKENDLDINRITNNINDRLGQLIGKSELANNHTHKETLETKSKIEECNYATKLDSMHTHKLLNDLINGQEAKAKTIGNNIYSITEINGFKESFLWVTDNSMDDLISLAVRKGDVPIEKHLFDLFKSPGVFLDLGANIGAFSLSFAADGWTGFAVEASSRNNNVLRKSIELNNFNINLCDKIVYKESGEQYFIQNGPWGYIGSKISEDDNYEKLDAISLDDYKNTELKDIKNIDFIKMDIEGSEVYALKGMHKFLEKMGFPIIFTEVNNSRLMLQDFTHIDLFEEAKKSGYKPFLLENGKMREVPDKMFVLEGCQDFFLIKNLPSSFIPTIDSVIEINHEEIISLIISELSSFKIWKDGIETDILKRFKLEEKAALCYILKEYPEYLENSEINNLLKEIKAELPEEPFFKKALSWYAN